MKTSKVFPILARIYKNLFESEEKDALLPLPETAYEYLERKTVKVGQDFSFVYDKVHYSMPQKYLRKTLEIRAGTEKIYVYNDMGICFVSMREAIRQRAGW